MQHNELHMQIRKQFKHFLMKTYLHWSKFMHV